MGRTQTAPRRRPRPAACEDVVARATARSAGGRSSLRIEITVGSFQPICNAVAAEGDPHGDQGARNGGARRAIRPPARPATARRARSAGRADPAMIATTIGWVTRRATMSERRGLTAFGQDRRQRHRHRQVDGDQQEQRHRARLAIGLEDHRHADEDGVGLSGREPATTGDRRRVRRNGRAITVASAQTTPTPTKYEIQ